MMGEWQGDVVIVGGGPVGLLLGNLLGQEGIRCAVVERRETALTESRAIGVTPPSLDIMRSIGLDGAFVSAGVRVDTAFVHDERGCLGRMYFGGLPGAYPFILSLPQAETVRMLREGLGRFGSVDYFEGDTVTDVKHGPDGVEVIGERGGSRETWRASFAVGCDGVRSVVRRLIGVPQRRHSYGSSFLMGDFEDGSGLGAEAHLFFTPTGSVESFPLPGGLRRWIVQAKIGDEREGLLVRRVRALSGYDLGDSVQVWESGFAPQRADCVRYSDGRVVLCGDAAHVMSPIGGQGMNVGFGDAVRLRSVLVGGIRDGAAIDAGMVGYERERRRAFVEAARKAEWGMWLGTRRGLVASRVRGAVIRYVMLRAPVAGRLRDAFGMR